MWNEKLRPSPTWPNPLAKIPVEMSSKHELAAIATPGLRRGSSVDHTALSALRGDLRRRIRPDKVPRSPVRTSRTTESYRCHCAAKPQVDSQSGRRAGRAARLSPQPGRVLVEDRRHAARRRSSPPGPPRCHHRPSTAPAGVVRPLGRPAAGGAVRRQRPRRWSCCCPAPIAGAESALTVFGAGAGPPRIIALPGPATAITDDGHGTAYLSTRGGYFVVDLAAGTASPGDDHRPARHRFHRDRPPRRRQAGARQRRRRRLHPGPRTADGRPSRRRSSRASIPLSPKEIPPSCWIAGRPR